MKKLSKNALVILIIAIAAAAALVGAAFWGKEHYKDHFIQGTTINGWDYSDATVKETEKDIKDSMKNYKLEVKLKDGESETLDCSSLDIKCDDKGKVKKLMEEQDNTLWFTHMGNQHFEIDLNTEFNEEELNALVEQMDCFKPENVTMPQNAHVAYVDGQLIIEPEIEGNMLDIDRVKEAIREAVSEGKESIDLEALDLYYHPEIRSDAPELQEELEAKQKIFDIDITYDFVDRQIKLDKEELATWITNDENGNAIVDKAKVAEWVNKMAYETDTFGLSRKFMTSYGVEIELVGGGDYGWCIDKEATTEQLYAYVSTSQSAVLQPIYLFSAMDRSTNDIGGTYVEVCISTQTLWAYKDGQLLTTTPVITGCDAKGYSTPSGDVWAIDAKKTDWKFTHFANAYSDFWMPFNDECGLHDASWQAPETYEIPGYYITGGSHGCVNTPYDSMKAIYENFEIGAPVVVYYSTEQVVGPAPTQTLIAG